MFNNGATMNIVEEKISKLLRDKEEIADWGITESGLYFVSTASGGI